MSTTDNQLEVWMRGPINDVPGLLQPVAHALLQAKEEVERHLEGFADHLLWVKPGGMASVGFHLQHMAGVVDRLFTYARDEKLSESQFTYLRLEGEKRDAVDAGTLVRAFAETVEGAIQQLRNTDSAQLTEPRFLGRKRIPTTLMGLLFHAAEHIQRHGGQLLVTVRWVSINSQ